MCSSFPNIRDKTHHGNATKEDNHRRKKIVASVTLPKKDQTEI